MDDFYRLDAFDFSDKPDKIIQRDIIIFNDTYNHYLRKKYNLVSTAVRSYINKHTEYKDIRSFHDEVVSPDLNLVLSDKPLSLLQSLNDKDYYIQVASTFAFYSITRDPYVLINSLYIDTDSSFSFLNKCLTEVAISRYTKCKKIAFTKDAQCHILYKDMDKYNYYRQFLIELKNKYKN